MALFRYERTRFLRERSSGRTDRGIPARRDALVVFRPETVLVVLTTGRRFGSALNLYDPLNSGAVVYTCFKFQQLRRNEQSGFRNKDLRLNGRCEKKRKTLYLDTA